jgi:hypothetical protein
VLVLEEHDANGMSLGAVSVEVDGAGPRSCDDAGGLSRNLVVRGVGLGMPGSAAPGDAIPAPESSGAVGPGATGLLLPGSPDSPLPPIDWGQVEDNAEFACS